MLAQRRLSEKGSSFRLLSGQNASAMPFRACTLRTRISPSRRSCSRPHSRGRAAQRDVRHGSGTRQARTSCDSLLYTQSLLLESRRCLWPGLLDLLATMAHPSTQSSADDAFMADLLKDVDQAAAPASQSPSTRPPPSSFATAFRSKQPPKQPSLSQISQSLFAKPKTPRPPPQPSSSATGNAAAGPSRQTAPFSRGSQATRAPIRSQSAQSPLRAIKTEPASNSALSDASFAVDDDWLADLDDKELMAPIVKPEPSATASATAVRPPGQNLRGSSLVKQASRTQSKLWAQRAKQEKVSCDARRATLEA